MISKELFKCCFLSFYVKLILLSVSLEFILFGSEKRGNLSDKAREICKQDWRITTLEFTFESDHYRHLDFLV